MLQTAHCRSNAGVVYFKVEEYDRLMSYPACGIFYFPGHRHQIEGTDVFLLVSPPKDTANVG